MVLGTVISSLTSTLFYLLQSTFGKCWGNVQNICWQKMSRLLDLREESFSQLTNGVIFPRMLQQLGLNSYRVVWLHDANAQTGDCVQWGWIALPTKSYLLSLLALFGVTHYVYIHHNLTSMEMVGPASGISALISSSTAATTSKLNEAQLGTLQRAMGMGDSWTQADMLCTFWEKRLVSGILCCVSGCLALAMVVLSVYRWPYLALAMVVGGVSILIVLRRCGYSVDGGAISQWYRYPSQNMPTEEIDTSVPLLETHLPDEAFASGSTTSQPPLSDILDTHAGPAQVALEEYAPPTVEPTVKFSLMIARAHFYEVVTQQEIIPVPHQTFVQFADVAQVYGVGLQPAFMRYLAERTFVPFGSALNICVYNPMIDPYLVEICENFKKGVELENLLLVVLPPLATLSADLRRPAMLRNRTSTCTRFVTTLADFEAMLLQMTTGLFRHVNFVIPIDDRIEDPATNETWQACQKVLGHCNCHSDTLLRLPRIDEHVDAGRRTTT